jgi:hypothetical protein
MKGGATVSSCTLALLATMRAAHPPSVAAVGAVASSTMVALGR